jgi:hypothetical protein
MSRPTSRRVVNALAIAWLVAAWSPATALEPNTPAPPKPDWAGLDGLLAEGDYTAAVAAADAIAAAVKPKRRDADFLPRSIELLRALMRRGFAELRLGRLDDAAETLAGAYRTFKDRDLQRLLSLEGRSTNARVLSMLVMVEINSVELLDLRMAVILERLRFLNLELETAGKPSAEREAEIRTQVGEWIRELEVLERNAREAREALAERLARGGESVLASPYNRSLAGKFRPALAAGIRALELGRLPLGPPRSAAGEPESVQEGDTGPAAAVRHFQEAAAALDEAIAAAAPKGIAGMKPEQRMEAALMRAELLVAEGAALLATGESARGRAQLAQAMTLRQEAAVLRKLRQPAAHPDLFWPMLLSAEVSLDDARQELAAGDAARARSIMLEADALLTRTDQLPLPPEHPLRARLAAVRSRLEATLAAIDAKIPSKDAADAAARRLRRVLDATAASESSSFP